MTMNDARGVFSCLRRDRCDVIKSRSADGAVAVVGLAVRWIAGRSNWEGHLDKSTLVGLLNIGHQGL